MSLQRIQPFLRETEEIRRELFDHRDNSKAQESIEGLTDARSAVGLCLGSGLFGSYNSD